MKPIFCADSRRSRLEKGGVSAEINVESGEPHASAPRACSAALARLKIHAHQLGRSAANLLLILFVLGVTGETQIRPGVIACVAVSMIDQAWWPVASHVEPGKAVSLVDHAIDAHDEVAFCVCASEHIASLDPWPRHFCREDSSARIVVGDLFQAVGS